MSKTIGLKNRKLVRDIMAGILTVLIIGLIVYLVVGEMNKRPNNEPNLRNVETLTEWTVVNEDGSTMPITLPNSSTLSGQKTVTLEKQLEGVPEVYDSLLVWSKGQKIELFINNELWYEYSPERSDGYGINSTYLYLFVPLPKNMTDAKIKIVFTAVLDRDGGKLGEVLIGEQTACLLELVKLNQLELFLGLFALLLGVIALVISAILSLFTKREIHLYYLACCVLVLAFWVVANCRARQFIFPNASVIRDCAYLVLPLIAISFAVYLDRIQDERYHIGYLIIEVASIINLGIIAVLNYTGVAALSNTRMGSLIIIVLTMLMVVVTMAYDLFKRKDRSYIFVAIGLALLALCGIIQLVMEQVLSLSVISGTFMSIGLIFLVIFGLLQAVKKINQMNTDRNEAIEQVEHLSRTAMEALAKTVDAKDRYTSGHSMRVAEVACLIAEELGWNDEQISELRFQGMMHDIGKIGVPDSVLNKPGRLNSIEFELVQSHTTVGSDILKNVTSIPGVEKAARHHHERFDGNGYPDHLIGEEIPINARIIGVADAYDAMNSDRIYRKALPKDVIRKEIVNGRGTQFDPFLVDVFIKLLDEDRLVTNEGSDSFVSRQGSNIDTSKFAIELNDAIDKIRGDNSLETVERVKLGEVTSVFRNLRDEYEYEFMVIAFSIRPKEDMNVTDEYLEKATDTMKISIQKSIRDEDISVRYSNTQMLAVLFNADPNSINLVVQRILLDFYKLFDASPLDISYKILDIDAEYKMGFTIYKAN
jgi:hypothetical protein